MALAFIFNVNQDIFEIDNDKNIEFSGHDLINKTLNNN